MDFIPGVGTLGTLAAVPAVMPFGLGGQGEGGAEPPPPWAYYDDFEYPGGDQLTAAIGSWSVVGRYSLSPVVGWHDNSLWLDGACFSLATPVMSEYTIGFAFKPASVQSRRAILQITKGQRVVAGLWLNQDGSLSVFRGGDFAATIQFSSSARYGNDLGSTPANTIYAGDWAFLEMHVILGTSGEFTLRNYGEVILSGSDVNIDAVGDGNADGIKLYGEARAGFDDFYATAGLRYWYDALVAPHIVTETVYPVLMGNYSEMYPLVGHPEADVSPVDVVSANPEVTTNYLVSSDSGVDFYASTFYFGATSLYPTKIFSVTSRVWANLAGGGLNFFVFDRALGRIYGTLGGITGGGWSWHEHTDTLTPVGRVPWFPGSITGIDSGVEAQNPGNQVGTLQRVVTYLGFGPSAAPAGVAVDVSASTRVLFRGDAHAYVSPIEVSAMAMVNLSAAANLATRFWEVSATTGFAMASSLSYVFNRAYDVSATTRVRLRAGAAAITNHTFDVSASTRIALTPKAELAGRFWEVAAANRIALRSSAQAIVNHTFNVSASTCLRLASTAALAGRFWEVAAATRVMMKSSLSAVVNHTWDVSASTALSVRAIAASSRVCVVAASSAITLSQTAVSGRDLFVSASTSFGMSPGLKSNEFIGMSASGSFTMNASAGAYVTGTLAQSGFVMTGVAYATVVFPWRRQSLTLPPGGNLPHS